MCLSFLFLLLCKRIHFSWTIHKFCGCIRSFSISSFYFFLTHLKEWMNEWMGEMYRSGSGHFLCLSVSFSVSRNVHSSFIRLTHNRNWIEWMNVHLVGNVREVRKKVVEEKEWKNTHREREKGERNPRVKRNLFV